jgi:hypothetical protein
MRLFSKTFSVFLLISLSGCWHHPTENLNWQTYSLDGSGISIDLPYPFEVKKTEQKINTGTPIKIIFGVSRQPSDYSLPGFLKEELEKIMGKKQKRIFFDFHAFVRYEQTSNKGKGYRLKEIADRWVNSFYKVYQTGQNKNVALTKEPFQRSGISGILITDSCDDYDGNRFLYTHHDSFIYLTKGTRLWRLDINYATNNETADPELAASAVDRIIRSLKIEPK